MADTHALAIPEISALSLQILARLGFSAPHAHAITDVISACQIDDCQSHGLFRLFMCADTMAGGQVDGSALPQIDAREPGIVHADAGKAMSLLALEAGLPHLIEKARSQGIAALAIHHCFHFSALWPEVEKLSAARLAGLAMVPSHAWVAPAGGTRGALGTNPLAFSWPRPDGPPFTFDFATSAFARGEIELYRRAGKPLPEGVAIDAEGNPTTDPQAAMEGAMLTFGGHKGSALSIMIELLAGPLIDDLTSLESMAVADGNTGAPYHGEILIAFNPEMFARGNPASGAARAERLFAEIEAQEARLPSQRRYAARARNLARGYVEIPQSLYDDLQALKS